MSTAVAGYPYHTAERVERQVRDDFFSHVPQAAGGRDHGVGRWCERQKGVYQDPFPMMIWCY